MDGRPKASEIKKYLMWSKINELKREGHSISRIKSLTGYDRKTIRKYLAMSEKDLLEHRTDGTDAFDTFALSVSGVS